MKLTRHLKHQLRKGFGHRRRRIVGLPAAVAAIGISLSLLLSACGGGSGGSAGGTVEITLAGPNQWNNDPKSFGPAWEDLIKRFEKREPNIKVNTTVLPIPEFAQTLSTQLTAGTAPELIFNQTPHEADQVVPLTKYLNQPNPYAPDSKTWLQMFNQNYFGPSKRNAKNQYEWVPFNLVIVGVFYNKDILDKAGVTPPLKNYGDLIDACSKIKAAGYIPFAMDNGWLGQGWTYSIMNTMLMAKYADKLNVFDEDGNPGKSEQVAAKSITKAVLTGQLSATKTPEVGETLKLMKNFFDKCATPNWSGITGGASFIGGEDFVGGKAAMTYGTNFAADNLKDVSWKYGTMPFPTITQQESTLSDGSPAQFGAQAGGTSYMIPSTTKDEKLDAAIKFLQFATSPEGGQPWLDKSGGIPATADGDPAPGLEGLMSGDWFKTPALAGVDPQPKANASKPQFDGYLLGSKNLQQTLDAMQKDWIAGSKEAVKDGGYTEAWAKQNG